VAQLLVLALYGAALGILAVLPQPSTPGLLLSFQLVSTMFVVVGPIIVYSMIDRVLTLRAVTKAARAWWAERSIVVVRVDRHKNHFTAILLDHGKPRGAKFRVKFFHTTWNVKEVNWL
jgi:hypothetical protein